MRILVIRLSALGDIILTTGPLKVLKEQNPDLKIHFLTDDSGAQLLAESQFLDQIHTVPKGTSALKLIQLVRGLGKFERVIDLQAKPKTMALRFFAGKSFFSIEKQSRKRRAFVKNRRYANELGTHVVQKYYQALQKALGVADQTTEALRPIINNPKAQLPASTFDFSKAIAIHPYASQSNKVWPFVNELTEHLLLKGYSVVIVGQDSGTQQYLVREKVLNLTNQTSLSQMATAIAQSKALISTDSGPMHLGIGLGVPTVAIFGPTTKEFGFYPTFKHTAVAEVENLDCRPCHVHGGNHCPLKHHRCMKDIIPSQVLRSLESVLK